MSLLFLVLRPIFSVPRKCQILIVPRTLEGGFEKGTTIEVKLHSYSCFLAISVLPSSFFLSFSCLNTPSSSATIVSKLKSFIVPRGRHVFLKNTQFVTSMDNGSSNNNFLKHLARIIRCIPSRYVELKYFPFSRSTPCKIK